MVTFTHVATLVGGPSSHVTGITDLEIRHDGDAAVLYATTRPGGGVSAYGLEPGATRLLDQRAMAGGDTLAAGTGMEILEIGGRAYALPLGSAGSGLTGYALTAEGGFGGRQVFTGGRDFQGDVTQVLALEIRGETLLFTAGAGQDGLTAWTVDAAGALARAGDSRGAGRGALSDVSALAAAQTPAGRLVLAASATGDCVTALRVGADGSLTATGRIGAAEGLGIDAPTALATVALGGETYAVVGASGSSSLSVLRVEADGSLTAVDHVLDSLQTRFQSLTRLEIVEDGDRVYVLAGGGDDGLSLFTLLPGGRLLHLGSVADTPGTTLEDISAIAATVADGTLRIFASGEAETGITEMHVELGAQGRTWTGGNGADRAIGTGRNDLLAGGGGGDRLDGGAGDDILMDGRGSDTLRGGAGADTFVFEADGAADRVLDFEAGIDRLDLSGFAMLYSLDQLTHRATASGAVIRFGDEEIRIDSADGGSLSLRDLFPAGLDGPSRPPLVLADRHLDIHGSAQGDLLAGRDGNDIIRGLGGEDRLEGGLGRDRLFGGTGADTLLGGQGNDVLRGGAGSDRLEGNAGRDVLRGGDGHDRINGAGQDDLLFGAVGDDRLTGGTGSDRLVAGAGADVLFGNAGRDRLEGGAGADRLYGGAGADRLEGGTGADILTGAAGADVFRFTDGMGRDRVTDFGRGADRIALDDALWGGRDLTPQQVVNRFAEIHRGDAVFDFGGRDVLRLEDVDSLNGLADLLVLF